MAVEDLDDDAGAVEDLAARRALEVARLARRQIVIDGDESDLGDGDAVAVELGLFLFVVLLLCVVTVLRGLGGLTLDPRLVLLLRGGRADVPVAARELTELEELALAEHRAGLEVSAHLRDLGDRAVAEGRDETLELFDARTELEIIGVGEMHGNEHGLPEDVTAIRGLGHGVDRR